jgi:hypothetical protein
LTHLPERLVERGAHGVVRLLEDAVPLLKRGQLLLHQETLSSEFGTCKTATAKFWLCLSVTSP